MYYIGQGFGILATICCFIMPLFKKKWQMLAINIVANASFALNLLFIGEISSAIIVNIVAIVQILISLWHVQKEKPVTTIENIVFLILYLGLGSMGYKNALDILPLVGAALNMWATFQRDEQKTRILVMLNGATFFTYYLIIGSTNMFAELLAVITAVIGLIKYRKRAN